MQMSYKLFVLTHNAYAARNKTPVFFLVMCGLYPIYEKNIVVWRGNDTIHGLWTSDLVKNDVIYKSASRSPAINLANTKHLYNIFTTLDQRRIRCADVVQMLYKCFVFAGEMVIPSKHKMLAQCWGNVWPAWSSSSSFMLS